MTTTEQLQKIVKGGTLFENEILAKHTTFGIGGMARYYVIPSQMEEFRQLLLFLIKENIPYYVMGKGSNILFGDQGFDGAIIEIGKGMDQYQFISDCQIKVSAGISLAKLAVAVAKQSLTGFEFASGIPGALGGAVAMNAGAYGGELKDVVKEVVVMNRQGEIVRLTKEQMEFGYRHSIVFEKDYLVLEAVLEFEKGNHDEIMDKMKQLNQQRKEKQPLEYGSAGSTFKRPEGYYAGKLIQDAGLQGFRVGDAQVSEKHCGFVINRGNATAKEVITLIEEVKRKVKETSGVELELEVRLIGEF